MDIMYISCTTHHRDAVSTNFFSQINTMAKIVCSWCSWLVLNNTKLSTRCFLSHKKIFPHTTESEWLTLLVPTIKIGTWFPANCSGSYSSSLSKSTTKLCKNTGFTSNVNCCFGETWSEADILPSFRSFPRSHTCIKIKIVIFSVHLLSLVFVISF